MKMCQIQAEPYQQARIIAIIRNKAERIGISNVNESGLGITIEEDAAKAERIYQELIEEIRQLR